MSILVIFSSQAAVARRALQLFVRCFGFDYADESANVVVPPSWRPIVTRGDAAHTVMATLFYLHKHQARVENVIADVSPNTERSR